MFVETAGGEAAEGGADERVVLDDATEEDVEEGGVEDAEEEGKERTAAGSIDAALPAVELRGATSAKEDPPNEEGGFSMSAEDLGRTWIERV